MLVSNFAFFQIQLVPLHPGAFVEIPELEFEIGADHRRRVDSVYNHIAASIFNLERHVEMLGEDNEQAVRAWLATFVFVC
jgi:hypothetical protein